MDCVLVSPRLVENESYPERRDALDVRWAGLLAQAGLFGVMVPSHGPSTPYFELSPVGLLLTGGNDLSTVSDDPLSKLRDDRELELIERALEAHLPILGVCRGLQLIASRHGFDLEPIEGHVGREHSLEVMPESRFLSAFTDATVNSYHQLGVRGSSEELLVSARSDDGAIEAVEHPSLQVLGIMWHPERYPEPREADVALLRRFFAR